jgi:hypothetical protein
MSKMQRLVIMVLVATLAAGGSTALAKGNKNHANQPAATNVVTVTSGTPSVGKQHHAHHPHGVVTAVSADSITIEKVKKHKSKTFKVAANVAVEKKHGKKHGQQAQVATGATSGKHGGKHAHSGGKGTLAEVKVGDHVKLTLEGKQVVKIEDKGAGKGHKHGKNALGGKQPKSLGQGT